MNYYDVLRVNQNAHVCEINQAFRILAKKYHPDFNKNHDAAEKFIYIHEAYSVLKNLDKRKTYNESLCRNPNKTDGRKYGDVPFDKDQIYKPGDRGPAGGLVFYDNGNNSCSWRYMEVSPVDVRHSYRSDERAQWSPFDLTEYLYDEKKALKHIIFLTETGIGCGKKNTELIIDVLENKSGRINRFLTGNAAQLCGQYALNGYNDWFLPSKDELNELYKSVKQHNLKGFSNLEHWSSSKTSRKTVWTQFFKDGTQAEHPYNHIKSIRAVRYF